KNGFKIETWRVIQISMARACITVDATMFAGTRRIYGAVERDIGRAIARDDGSGGFRTDRGTRQLWFDLLRLDLSPIIDYRSSFVLLESRRAICNAAPSCDGGALHA